MKVNYAYIRKLVENKKNYISYVEKRKNNGIYIIPKYVPNLSEEFMERFQNELNWENISHYQVLSGNFIEKFQNRVNWCYISCHQTLSENFIEKFQDKVNWDYISYHQKLSENFIEKFQDKVNWNNISHYQVLSGDFIEKFQNKISWYNISFRQNLSEKFILKYIDKLYLEKALIRQPFSDEFLCSLSNKNEGVVKRVMALRSAKFSLKIIKRFKPCKEGVERYLKVFRPEEVITWKEFITRYRNTEDILWLYNKLM